MPGPPGPTTAGTKTVTTAAAPHLTAAHLTALLAKPVELLTVGELAQLHDAISRAGAGSNPAAVIGTLLP